MPPAQQVDLRRIRATEDTALFFSPAARTWNVNWLADHLSKRAPSGPPISLQLISWLAKYWDNGQHFEVVTVTTRLTLPSKNNWFSYCLLTARRSHDGFIVPLIVQWFFYSFFAGQAVLTSCVHLQFTDSATVQPFVEIKQAKFSVCSPGAKKNKEIVFPILFEAFIKYECFYFYLSISYTAHKMWGSVPISAPACFHFC